MYVWEKDKKLNINVNVSLPTATPDVSIGKSADGKAEVYVNGQPGGGAPAGGNDGDILGKTVIPATPESVIGKDIPGYHSDLDRVYINIKKLKELPDEKVADIYLNLVDLQAQHGNIFARVEKLDEDAEFEAGAECAAFEMEDVFDVFMLSFDAWASQGFGEASNWYKDEYSILFYNNSSDAKRIWLSSGEKLLEAHKAYLAREIESTDEEFTTEFYEITDDQITIELLGNYDYPLSNTEVLHDCTQSLLEFISFNEDFEKTPGKPAEEKAEWKSPATALAKDGNNFDVLTKHVEVVDREATFLDDFSVDVGDTLYVDVEELRHLNLRDCFRELGVVTDDEYPAYYYIVFNCVTHDGDIVPVRACIQDRSIFGSDNIMSLGFGQYDGPDPYAEIMWVIDFEKDTGNVQSYADDLFTRLSDSLFEIKLSDSMLGDMYKSFGNVACVGYEPQVE